MRLGAHLSIAGGIDKAAKAAVILGANCLQIFSGPPRSWQTRSWSLTEINQFKKIVQKGNIKPIFVHGKYLVNLSSQNKKILRHSANSVIYDLHFAQNIGARGVIIHFHQDNWSCLAKTLGAVLSQTTNLPWLVLENSAQVDLRTIGKLIRSINHPRLKFCLDLAHAWQAGYDLTTPSGLNQVFAEIEKEIGFERWVAIHANDSATPLGSRLDRHENIGCGKLGPFPFFVFLNHPVSSKLPFFLETPGFGEKGLKADKQNLASLKKLVGKRLDRNFFLQPTLRVAKKLLGKILVVKRGSQFKAGLITETEAYVGPEDRASHAFRGKTPRTAVMWDKGGKLYVYLIYGVHHCLNIVTEKRGFPAAVLIRAIKPIFGISGKTDGPGKLCRELGFTRADTGLDITQSKGVCIKDIGKEPQKIITTPRVGVDYAGEWAKKKWRFLAVFNQKEKGLKSLPEF